MGKKYDISIVTPFHDVNLEVFKHGVESIKKQTLGFENVEWIVVLHNCGQEYIEGAHALLDEYDNVVVEELKNDKHTPSSPRNLGISLASGRYIGFLDGDDSYLPDCMERVLHYIKKNEAQVAVFRREYELETRNSMPVTEIVLWDQTREEIVVDHDHWDDEKMFTGVFGMVTSKIYDLAFLNKHNIRFDETVLFGEDFLFNFEVYGKIDRAVYLPQLIGYHYFINSGSLVQSGKKSPELLLEYAKGYTKIFDKGIENGFYVNSVISRLCVVLAKFLMACTEMSIDQRKQVRDMLSPYIDRTTLMAPSKIYPPQKARECYEIPRRIIINMEDIQEKDVENFMYMHEFHESGVDVALMSLNKILNENATTDMGRRYGFSDILTMTGYQEKMPLSDYETYRPLIQLTTRIGESGIFTSAPIIAYVQRIECDGEVKQIPCTQKSIRSFEQEFEHVIQKRKTFLFFESFERDIVYNDNAYLSNTSGMVLDSFYEKYCMKKIDGDLFTSPKELLFPEEIENLNFLKMLYALKERNVEQIVSSYAWIVLDSFRMLEKEWQSLCDCIETGELPYTCCQNKKLWKQLNDTLTKDPERANELRAIFAQGFEEPVVKKIWPQITRIVALGAGCFHIYMDKLRRYIGDLEHSNGVYSMSETLVGKAKAGSDEFDLILGDTFYEFAPALDRNAVPKMYKEIESGKEYELVVTTRAGLYRYRTGEVVKIVNRDDDGITFTHAYSVDQSTAYKTAEGVGVFHEGYLYDALKKLEKKYEMDIADYLYADRTKEEGKLTLKVYLELPNDVKMCDHMMTLDKAGLEESLRSCLEETLRESMQVVPVILLSIEYLQPQTQLLHRELLCYRNQLPEDQMKPLRKLTTEKETVIKMVQQQ